MSSILISSQSLGEEEEENDLAEVDKGAILVPRMDVEEEEGSRGASSVPVSSHG